MMQATTQSWDHTVDLLIVGTGAGAMTAALVGHDRGGDVLLIEKSDRYGGSSAMSGGSLWVPNNHLMLGADANDTPEDAMTYLRSIKDRLQTYVETAPRVLEYLEAHTHLKFQALPDYTDYYPGAPGSKPRGRSIEAQTFDGRLLGEDIDHLREQHIQCMIAGRVSMTALEARTMLVGAPGWISLMLRLMWRYVKDVGWRLRSRRDRALTMGNGLVGALRYSLMDRGIPIWLETPARELIVEEGRVVGLRVEREGRPLRIRARSGVVLAAGGFEGSQQMREQYLPQPTRVEWSVANKQNTGDAIRMGEAVGGVPEFMDDAWWGPTTCVPGEEHARMLVIEKGLPGSIIVNKRGQRFVNEAAPYIDVVKAMYEKNTPDAPSVPSYLVFDARYRSKYPMGPLLQSAQQPDWSIARNLWRAYIKKADTLSGLANLLGIDPAGLEAAVERFNEMARKGRDVDFRRGETIFDRYYGDRTVQPNPCLLPIEKPPFYGIEVYAGELGTKGGLRVDARARVLNGQGEVVEGLYAIGNCSSPLMGPTYAGAGATLGPAMTFGFIAAQDAVPQGAGG
jgi:3-oxosteroid 1-dehydrogenase